MMQAPMLASAHYQAKQPIHISVIGYHSLQYINFPTTIIYYSLKHYLIKYPIPVSFLLVISPTGVTVLLDVSCTPRSDAASSLGEWS